MGKIVLYISKDFLHPFLGNIRQFLNLPASTPPSTPPSIQPTTITTTITTTVTQRHHTRITQQQLHSVLGEKWRLVSGKSLINIGLGGVLSKKSELRKSGIYTQQS